MANLTFRELTAKEIDDLPDAFYSDADRLRLGGRYHGDMLGTIMGAFSEDELVGIWVVAPVLHMGPVWVAPSHRGASKDIRKGLYEGVQSAIHGFGANRALMVAMEDAPQVKHMIEKMPNTPVPGRFYVVEV